MQICASVSENAAPFLLDAITNHVTKLEQIENPMYDERTATEELRLAASRLRVAIGL